MSATKNIAASAQPQSSRIEIDWKQAGTLIEATHAARDHIVGTTNWAAAVYRHMAERARKASPPKPTWWRKRADEIEAQVALTGSPEAMRCYTDMRTLLQAATETAPECQTCNDHGAVGNVLTAEPCPDCTSARGALRTDQSTSKDDGFYEAINEVDGLYQVAPKAAPGEPNYSEKWDAELGRTAMRFVDRAGDVHPGIDDAETICAEFHKAMSEVIERMPHVQRMAAPQQEPASPIRVGWGRDYQDNGKPIDASAAPVPNLAAILQQEAQEPTAFIHWPINGPPRLVWYSQKALNDAILKTHEDGYKPDVKLYTAPQPAPAPLSDDDLVELGKSKKSGLHPWGIGTTRADYLRAVRAVLDASRKQGANHD